MTRRTAAAKNPNARGGKLSQTRHSLIRRLVATIVAVLQAGQTFALVGQERRQSEPTQSVPAQEKSVPNRTAPPVTAAPHGKHFSTPPTDAELFGARPFDEPLVPQPGPRSASEDAALAKAILTLGSTPPGDGLLEFERFIAHYPGTRWKGALLVGMGSTYRRTGYFTRALDAWEQAWGMLKGETDPRLRALADRALGELAELSARLGRYDRLERLFSEIAGRDVRGPASEKVVAAREGLAVMQKEPERAFLCGPFGLDRILASTRPGYVSDPMIAAAKSTRRGTSMRQMLELADSVGLKMQIAKRRPDAAIVTPALVHWKAGHFAALTEHSEGRVLLQDPTFGDNLWITEAALEDQASGYFLVPAGDLPTGWEKLPAAAGDEIWGKGITSGSNQQEQGPSEPSEPTCCPEENCGGGMAAYKVNLMLVNLHVWDSPVGYQPPVGPRMHFVVNYNQREVFQPQLPEYSNLGPKWTFNWFSYVEDDPSNPAQALNTYLRGGGQETYTGMTSTIRTSATHYESRAYLTRTVDASNQTTGYKRYLPDGSVEEFAQADGHLMAPRRFYLTASADAQGNTIAVAYSYVTNVGYRIASARDASGQYTTFAYDGPDPLKITKVTDPFGRFATFEYDTSGRLKKITDVIGITSEFTYAASDFIQTLTTPYGTTSFATGQTGNDRWLETTDPLAAKERFEYLSTTSQISYSETTTPSSTAMGIFNAYINARNTFYWDKRAMTLMPTLRDYAKARIYHWLHTSNINVTSGILESEKKPLESRIWYNYPGQTADRWHIDGTAATPTRVGRRLDDGSTQLYTYEYNSKGRKIKEIDPLGRETVYVYGTGSTADADPANGTGIDRLQAKQKNGAGYEVLWSATYNAQHQPLTVTDAAGQTSTYTYNTQGQLLTAVTPARAGITENRTTTFSYDSLTGHLLSSRAPPPG